MNVDLPEPLGPSSAEDLALAHLEIDAVQRLHAAERLAHAARDQQRSSLVATARHSRRRRKRGLRAA